MDPAIPNRDDQHGGVEAVGFVSQGIKHAMRKGINRSSLSSGACEALDMIAHKIGRILAGNPSHADHWHDIQGYAKLIEDRL